MNFQSDIELSKRARDGDEEAIRYLRDEIIPACLGAMLKQCTDGRSKEWAREIADDLLGEIVHVEGVRGHRKNLLEAYEGRASLKTWFLAIGLRKLRTWWKSGRCTKEWSLQDLNGEGGTLKISSDPDAPDDPKDVDAEMLKIAGESLRAAVASLDPLHWTLIQLAYLHDVEKQRLAVVMKHDNATSGRWIRDALGSIREEFDREIAARDPLLKVTLADFLVACRHRLDGDRYFFEPPDDQKGP